MLDLQHYGYAIAGIFFGPWLDPARLPRLQVRHVSQGLGIVLVVGGVSYLVDTLATFVAPQLTAMIHPLAALLGGVAEISTAWIPPREGRTHSAPGGCAAPR